MPQVLPPLIGYDLYAIARALGYVYVTGSQKAQKLSVSAKIAGFLFFDNMSVSLSSASFPYLFCCQAAISQQIRYPD